MITVDGFDFSAPINGLIPIMGIVASLMLLYIYFIPALILYSRQKRDDYVVMLLGFGGLSAAIISSLFSALGASFEGQILIFVIILSLSWVRALKHVLFFLLK